MLESTGFEMGSNTYSDIFCSSSCISTEIDDTASEYLLSYSIDSTYKYTDYLDYFDCLDCSLCNGEYDQEMIESNRNIDSWMFEPYQDFRSAGRAKQRERRSREDTGNRVNGYRCRKQQQTENRRDNKRSKREITRFAVQESQEVVQWFHPALVDWNTKLPDELDEWVTNMDDLTRYQVLHQDAETFESSEPYLEVGENFSAWCQRRIAEMRSVKERRIRLNVPPTFQPMLWQDKMDHRYGRRYHIYTGDATTTTLPTTAYDALGHELLRCVLNPGRWWVRQCQRRGKPPFRVIESYGWFGEYEWHWHQNLSGCWEVRRGGSCTSHKGEGSCAAIERGAGVMPAPEEMQKCSLFAWVGEQSREIMARQEARMGGWMSCLDDDDMDVSGSDSDCGWSVVSSASSERWSVVDTP
jgi:hypothetical protein